MEVERGKGVGIVRERSAHPGGVQRRKEKERVVLVSSLKLET